MVINCPECATKFRVSAEKIPAKGAKLRCARCSHIFFVKPEEETPVAVPTDAPQPEPATTEESPGHFQEPAAAEAGAAVSEDSFGTAGEAPDESDFGFEEDPAESDFSVKESSAGADDPFGDSDFGFAESPGEAKTESDDFGSGKTAPETGGTADNIDFGFADDSSPEADKEVPAESSADDFGFLEDDPAEAVGMGIKDEFDVAAFETEAPATADSDDNFAFDEDYGNVEIGGDDDDQAFSFGEEDDNSADSFTAEQPESEPESEMSTEEAAASFAEEPQAPESSHEEPAAEPYAPLESDDYADQDQSTVIQSSRKRSPFATLILFLLVLILAIVVAGGVLYWQSGPEAIQQLYQRIIGQETSVPVKGQILVKDLQGSFVSNKTAGELLVIQGKAVNNYRESRAALQVKGILFDNQGKQLRQKTIFCGNPISADDLRKLPFDKLEEIMGNQFGESLVNLNVTPGQVISFTIVFRDIPENLSEFVVEVAGSNPAAQ